MDASISRSKLLFKWRVPALAYYNLKLQLRSQAYKFTTNASASAGLLSGVFVYRTLKSEWRFTLRKSWCNSLLLLRLSAGPTTSIPEKLCCSCCLKKPSPCRCGLSLEISGWTAVITSIDTTSLYKLIKPNEMSSKSTLREMDFLKALRRLRLPEGLAMGYGKLGGCMSPFVLLSMPTTAAASSQSITATTKCQQRASNP